LSGADEKGFLGRWSAKKRGLTEEEAKTDATAVPAADGSVGSDRPDGARAEASPGKTDEEVLAELDLPDPDSLGPGDDFSRFMAETVPTRLRNRALRRLWISDPVLANLDELLDYGDDFTDAATVVENLQTAYQAGRGFLKDAASEEPEEGEEDAGAESGPDAHEPDAPEPDAPEPDAAETAHAPEPDPSASDASETAFGDDPETPETDALAAAPESSAPPPRHMRFRFDQG